jgi:hypothetical protein
MAKIVHFGPPKPKTPRKQYKRKSPDEWRPMNRAAPVKDGRPLILAFPVEKKPGEHILQQCYWHKPTAKWWLANTAPDHGFDAAEDLYGAPVFWRPMPAAPSDSASSTLAAVENRETSAPKKAAKKPPKPEFPMVSRVRREQQSNPLLAASKTGRFMPAMSHCEAGLVL